MTPPNLTCLASSTRTEAEARKDQLDRTIYLVTEKWGNRIVAALRDLLMHRDITEADGLRELQQYDAPISIHRVNLAAGVCLDVSADMAKLWYAEWVRDGGDILRGDVDCPEFILNNHAPAYELHCSRVATESKWDRRDEE